MAAGELSEYQWVLSLLPGHVQTRVLDVRARVQPILSTNLLPHFTDHSLSHSDRVVGILGGLLQNNLERKDKNTLSEHELVFLVLAALLHDIGMQLPKAHGIETNVEALSAEELVQIRQGHGLATGRVLRDLAKGQDALHIGLDDEKYRKYLPCVATISERHQSSAGYDPNETFALAGGKIRLGLLTALLRLADQLDCDTRRVSMDRLQHFSISVDSILHWLMCHYIDAVTVEDGLIEIVASHPETMSGSVMELLAERVLAKTKAEFKLAGETLWRNGVKLRLPEKIRLTGGDLTYSKRSLPEEVLQALQSRLPETSPEHVTVEPPSVSTRQGKREPDFMTFWRFAGNPFLDRAVSYGGDLFVETDQASQITTETAQHLSGPHGDLKLVIGERGMGKTTLFNTIAAKLGDKFPVHLIDVADLVIGVRNAADLHQLILHSIHTTLRPEKDFDTVEGIVDAVRRGNKKVICLDSLDRLPPERSEIVRDFLKTAQKFLTELRMTAVVLISCSDRWQAFLFDNELSYLGGRNQWILQPFSTEDLAVMLEKRLRTSGRNYSEVFEPGCAAAIHAISDGNPRRILQNAESLCRLAAQQGVTRITTPFIHQNYKENFEQSFQHLLDKLARQSDSSKKGLTSLYLFYLELERRNLDTAEGWRLLLELLKTKLPQEKVHPTFYMPLRYAGFLTSDLETKEVFYKPHPYIVEIFRKLAKEGFKEKDFVSFYSANPIRPVEESDQILLDLKSPLVVGEDVDHFERGRQIFLDLSRTKKPPTQTISFAWECVEEMLLAALIKHSKYTSLKYETAKEQAFFVDNLGRKRYAKGAGKVLADAAVGLINDFSEMMREKKRWVTTYNGIRWILGMRNNIVRGRTTHLLQYGEKERELCMGHLGQVFKELVQVYG